MTDQLTIAMAQLNQRVGDLAGNAKAMLEWRAKAPGADLIVYPEQQLIGYPAEDLVLKPAFAARAAAALAELANATADGGPAMLVGSIFVEPSAWPRSRHRRRPARCSWSVTAAACCGCRWPSCCT